MLWEIYQKVMSPQETYTLNSNLTCEQLKMANRRGIPSSLQGELPNELSTQLR